MIRKIISWALFFFAVWLAGLIWFVHQVPTAPSGDATKSDVIVVLTGGAGRLEYGMQLFAQGKSHVLYISGVSPEVTVADLLHNQPQNIRTAIAQLPNPVIVLGHKAENTIGNAEETTHWLRSQHYHSIRLVTSSYHIPRSVSEFTEVMPGVTIIPEPVFTDEFPASWWETDTSRMLILSEYHKYIASKLRHWMVSATRRAS